MEGPRDAGGSCGWPAFTLPSHLVEGPRLVGKLPREDGRLPVVWHSRLPVGPARQHAGVVKVVAHGRVGAVEAHREALVRLPLGVG
eukprot:scaffold26109_cov101-Isochrysis_galbana.AAC.3